MLELEVSVIEYSLASKSGIKADHQKQNKTNP
jgi:hypothetical protein